MADLRILSRAWVCLLAAYAALRFLPVRRVEALLEKLAGKDRAEISSAHLARLVDVAARFHLRPITCLPRSLALRALLRRHGVEADLLIGVRREEDGVLRAHAWIEDAGCPVGESGDVRSRFRPLSAARNES